MPDGFDVKITGGRTVWIDDFRCGQCGKTREQALRCGEAPQVCSCGGAMAVTIDKPKDWDFGASKGDDRIIWNDRQIEASHGKNWRETSKRPHMEGGAGARQYYDRGASRYRTVG